MAEGKNPSTSRLPKKLATITIEVMEGRPDQLKVQINKPLIWCGMPGQLVRDKVRALMDVLCGAMQED